MFVLWFVIVVSRETTVELTPYTYFIFGRPKAVVPPFFVLP